MKTKQIITMIAIILVVALIGGLAYGYYIKATHKSQNPIVSMEIEGYGTIKVELYPEIAPNTVTNFVKLANNGFYNGLTFHRVVENFMIQGGDKNGDGTGNPTLKDLDESKPEEAYTIKGEMLANGNKANTLRHEEGVISMARADYTNYSSQLISESYNSAGSQFFIMTKNSPSLNGIYTPFGKVIEGMDIVHQIEKLELAKETNEQTGEETTTDKPINPPVITHMSVETFGIDYGMPETLTPFDAQSWFMQNYGMMLQ